MKINTQPLNTNAYMSLQEFIIERDLIENQDSPAMLPLHVVESLIRYHIIPLNVVRIEFGASVLISKNSGFRSFGYERKKGRHIHSNLLHTFGEELIVDIMNDKDYDPTSRNAMKLRGASDVTVKALDRFDEFAILLARAGFKRICIYPDKKFIHVDYFAEKLHFFVSTDERPAWKSRTFEQYLEYAELVAEHAKRDF